mgnify:CR=1 FL=1
MNKAKKAKMVFLASVVVIELAAVIMIVKSITTDSSPTTGITFLAIGLIFLVIGMTRKSENAKTDQS